MRNNLFSLSTIILFSTYATVSTTVAKQIIIQNNCPHDLQAGWQTNGEPRGQVVPVALGGSSTIDVADDWAGRVWARESCDIHDCTLAGAGNPASLAEFKMTGANDVDYYDVSFVDGYNLPIRIEPSQMTTDHSVENDPRHCQPTFCNHTPSCPSDLIFLSSAASGGFVACQSACSRYQQDEYCCTGAHATPSTCVSNHFARAIKKVCPDVYTYPYDDELSVYACQAPIYTVTFCP